MSYWDDSDSENGECYVRPERRETRRVSQCIIDRAARNYSSQDNQSEDVDDSDADKTYVPPPMEEEPNPTQHNYPWPAADPLKYR